MISLNLFSLNILFCQPGYKLLKSGPALATAKQDVALVSLVISKLGSWASQSVSQYWNKLQAAHEDTTIKNQI